MASTAGLAATTTALLITAGSLVASASQAPFDGSAAAFPTTDTRSMTVTVAPGEVLHVEATGSGSTVVIVPGLFGGAYSFRKVMEPIAAAGHQVVIVEPLGIGASGRPGGADYSLEAQARRVGMVLDSLNVTSATFVAHSVGTSLVLRLALARPGLVRHIVSVDGGIAETASTSGMRRSLSVAGVLGRFGLKRMVMRKVEGRIRASSGDQSWITREVMAGYLAPMKNDFSRVLAVYKAMASASEPRPLAPRLARVRCPVDLLIGAAPHDGAISEQELATMRTQLHALTITPVPGAGHWIQEERPQALVEAVQRAGLTPVRAAR